MWEQSLKNKWVEPRADVAKPNLATWHDQNVWQLESLMRSVWAIYNIYIYTHIHTRKLGLRPTKVKTNSRPKSDSININQGEEAK